MTAPDYVELQVTSNFSFLRGASHPEELALTAARLGHRAIAITDRNSLAGVVRAHLVARHAGIRLVVGCRLDLEDGLSVLCFPTDRAAYGRLSELLTLGKRRAPKGECWIGREDLFAHADGQVLVALAPEASEAMDDAFESALAELRRCHGGSLYLAAQCLYRGDDHRRLAQLADLGARHGAALVATNDVHAHSPTRRRLQDVLTCIREHCTVAEAGYRLFANAERHLKPGAEMARLFRDHPQALAHTLDIADACRFSLDELRYEYPDETVPGGRTPQAELGRLTWEGAAFRYPGGVPDKVRATLRHELELISHLDYARYFLTVHDVVRFARSQGILCQGRGSAANSAVCFCLRITEVDPDRIDLLFERFVSSERNEPPDIDVDFEHERREEVIQYIYEKYGRERAGLTATVITYRSRSAVREVCKALGLSADIATALNGTVWGWSSEGLDESHLREVGLDPADPTLCLALELSHELIGFPRHLSQHVGGFVITRGPLSEVVPIANAAMVDRTMIEWDKDDIDALGILKIDVLGLGMLTCIRKAFDLIAHHHGRAFTLATVPAEDAAVYDMLCQADSVGVFQVESRAQMTMLPRLRPRHFYDLVIEVAIVRPGPIQGDMVHPYLRRRGGEEAVEIPSEELRTVLEKTCGVPLFQEQAMQIAIVAAGFTPTESDGLRRAMATFRRMGTIHTYRDKFIGGMVARDYDPDFAARCFKQIEGFGDYGFPESHAASFALLVYVSAWLKCHYPAAFACALLNSQPMGFYAPAQIVRDLRDHNGEVRAVDVNHSDWDSTLEPCPVGAAEESAGVALRLGLRQIKGFAEAQGQELVAARGAGGAGDAGYEDMRALWRRSGLAVPVLQRLAEADAFRSIGLTRRQALWAVKGLGPAPLPLFAAAPPTAEADREPEVRLPAMTIGEEVINDYAALRLTLKRHPLALLRPSLAREGYVESRRLADIDAGKRVRVAGLVMCRQRPGTASGVIFITLEDETGVANLIIWPRLFERARKAVLRSRLLAVIGKLEREGLVIHVVADRLIDMTDRLLALGDAKRALAQMPHAPRAAPAPAAPLLAFAAGRGDEAGGGGGGPDTRGQSRRLFPSRDFH